MKCRYTWWSNGLQKMVRCRFKGHDGHDRHVSEETEVTWVRVGYEHVPIDGHWLT